MNPSRFTRVKIIFGYAVLLIVLLFGLLFIRKEIRTISNTGMQQELMTDSLIQILAEKDKSVLQLIQLMNKANEQSLSTNEIEKIVAEQDSVFTQQRVHKTIVAKHDTVIAKPPRKKFFRRVADVFSPSKKDTSVVVNTVYEISVDTVLSDINPADSLHQRILKANVANKEKRVRTAQRNSAYFKRLNQELTARIDSIMLSYESNIAQQANAMAEREDAIRNRVTRILRNIAVGAIVLALIFIIVAWRELSRSNRYRKELEEANRKAAELLESREKLMLAITHDIKAPLGSIIGYLDLLSHSITEKNESIYIQNMQYSSAHLLRLVNDLLDFHRLDLNKMEVNRESFNPYQLFEELHISFTPLVQSKHLEFLFSQSEELNRYYVSDPQRLRQILTNLISNAIKFTQEGSVSFTAEYHQSTLVVKIADTGMGMTKEQQKLIFNEFTRLPQAQGQEGFGLGLSIVKKLITLLEGNIEVRSELNEGTVFIVSLPLYPVPGSILAAKSEKRTDEALDDASLKSISVIIIDDDLMQLNYTQQMLMKHGIDAVCCSQVDQLLDELRHNLFDVLITDIQMPAINGFDLLALLRSSNIGQSKEIPVIAVTARSEMKEEQFIESGFVGCLHKPFTVIELLKLLKRVDAEFKCTSAMVDNQVEEGSGNGKFDFAALLAFTENDKEEERAILTTFIKETQNDISIIEDALHKNNLTVLKAKAHKLLPLFTMLKADELINILLWTEKYDGDDLNDTFVNEMNKMVTFLYDSIREAEKYLQNR